MRITITRLITASVAASFLVAAPAQARKTTCHSAATMNSYRHNYRHAKRLHGSHAVGRQILAYGLSNGNASSCGDLRKSTVILKRQIMPVRAARYVTTGSPYRPPARIATVHAGSKLERIASCESGGNPAAVDPSGRYRGKYQFDMHTWASVGGSGDPAAASEAEQDRRAAMLYARSGAAPWPVCGSR